MKKIAFITMALATVYTAPAFAQDSQALCKLMATYKPGVDIHGNAVVPADLKAAASKNDVIKIPVTIDLAKNLTQNLPHGTEMDAAVSMIEIHKNGKVLYNGQDVTQQATAVCASAPAQAAAAPAAGVEDPDTMAMPGDVPAAPAADATAGIDVTAPTAETPPTADLTSPVEPAPVTEATAPADATDATAVPAATEEAAAPEPAPAPKKVRPAKPRYTEAQRAADREATAAAEAAARAAVSGGNAGMGATPPSAPINNYSAPTGTTDSAASGQQSMQNMGGQDFGESDPQVLGERAAIQAGANIGSTVRASSNVVGNSRAGVTTGTAPASAPAQRMTPPSAQPAPQEGSVIWGQGN